MFCRCVNICNRLSLHEGDYPLQSGLVSPNQLECLEETIGKKLDHKGYSGERSEGNKKQGRKSCRLREHTCHHEHNVPRNVSVRAASGQISDEMRKELLDTGGKVNRAMKWQKT